MKIFRPELASGEHGFVQAQAFIESARGREKVWYGVHKNYADYLTTETADSFLLASLIPAMQSGEDIYVEGPISEKLFYNLSNYYIRILTSTTPTLQKIRIFPEALSQGKELEKGEGVVTGFSAGIDSFAVLADHFFNQPPQSYQVNHFIYNNVGAFGGGGTKLFEDRYKELVDFANRFEIPFVQVDSNLYQFLKGIHFHQSHVLRNVSATLILQKLFSKYLYASGYKYEDCFIGEAQNMAYSDPVSVHLLSTELMDCISTGCQYSRPEKTEKVAQIKLSSQYLNVCIRNSGVHNCSECYKCLRTLLTLEILGKLEQYEHVFNLETYSKIRLKHMAQVLRGQDTFEKEIVQFAHAQGYEFPLIARITPVWAFSASNWVKQWARKAASRIIPTGVRKKLKPALAAIKG